MEFINAKTILNKVKQGKYWFGIDYNINLYRGCSHRCIYCDSRSNCYNITDFDKIRGKKNAINILEKELSIKRNKGVIGIGSMSDAYNPLEKKYNQTKDSLNLIKKYGFGVSIDTKSDLILRDILLLKEINKKNSVIVKFTITTPNDKLSKIIEPNVCESSKRLQAIKILADNGIFVGIIMNPILPFITDSEEDIKKLVELAHLNGAKFIQSYFGMTLRENQRDYYFDKLNKNFPGLKEKYIKYYGNKYNCIVPNHKNLQKVFINECNKYGILYNMSDIINAYKVNKNIEQMSFFKTD